MRLAQRTRVRKGSGDHPVSLRGALAAVHSHAESMGGARRPPPDACDGEAFDLPPTLHATWPLGGFNEHAFHEPRSRAYVFQGHSDAFLWKWFLLPVSSVGCLTFFLMWRSCLRVGHAALGT